MRLHYKHRLALPGERGHSSQDAIRRVGAEPVVEAEHRD